MWLVCEEVHVVDLVGSLLLWVMIVLVTARWLNRSNQSYSLGTTVLTFSSR